MADVFGDLREWDRVLALVDNLEAKGLLDEHQAGLARILRTRNNWQLLERALRAAAVVRESADVLTAEVIHTLADPELDLDARVLAARAAGHLLGHRPAQASSFDPERAVQTVLDLAGGQVAPVLQSAITEAIAALRAPRR